MNEIINVNEAGMLEAINRSEVDMQIATAKQYPRDINQVLNTISTLAKMDTETAQDCFYVLRRSGAMGASTIEGLSVRMAEIIASSWGNLRIQTRIIGNDGKTITAQGVCHDLQTNVAVSVEVKRRITDKMGKTYSEDMQVVTGNAASAIAFRNAVLKVVPKAVTKRVIEDVKKVALGQALDLETSRQNAIAAYAKLGVTEQQLLEYLEVKSRDEIDQQGVYTLRATMNAIKEGTTTVQETFVKAAEDKKTAQKAVEKAKEVQQVVEAAKAAQKPKK
jgi:hypothetical protein